MGERTNVRVKCFWEKRSASSCLLNYLEAITFPWPQNHPKTSTAMVMFAEPRHLLAHVWLSANWRADHLQVVVERIQFTRYQRMMSDGYAWQISNSNNFCYRFLWIVIKHFVKPNDIKVITAIFFNGIESHIHWILRSLNMRLKYPRKIDGKASMKCACYCFYSEWAVCIAPNNRILNWTKVSPGTCNAWKLHVKNNQEITATMDVFDVFCNNDHIDWGNNWTFLIIFILPLMQEWEFHTATKRKFKMILTLIPT